MNYNKVIEIDKNNLDEEAIQIPVWYDNAGKKEIEYQDILDGLKDKIPIIKADVSLAIRGWDLDKINSFFNLELKKVSEDVYKNLPLIHPEILNLYQKMNDARYQMSIYRQARRSIEKKVEMLKELAKLHGQGYFIKFDGGKAYKRPEMDLLINELKSQTFKRLSAEKLSGKKPTKPGKVARVK